MLLVVQSQHRAGTVPFIVLVQFFASVVSVKRYWNLIIKEIRTGPSIMTDAALNLKYDAAAAESSFVCLTSRNRLSNFDIGAEAPAVVPGKSGSFKRLSNKSPYIDQTVILDGLP